MNYLDFDTAKRSLYSLAHSIGTTGPEQNRIVDALREIELQCIRAEKSHKATVKLMLELLHNEIDVH